MPTVSQAMGVQDAVSTAHALSGTGYEVILAGLIAAAMAQLCKIILNILSHKPVDFRTMVATGGMPSSHSASMCGVATSVGFITGFDSISFAIAASISMIVMYDAAGVRRSAGKMAGILNRLTGDIYHNHPEYVPERLRELLGHTPFEVLVGAALGVTTAWVFHLNLLGA